jgi:hypothetical protein
MGEDLFLEVRRNFDSLEFWLGKKLTVVRGDGGKHM